MLPLQPKLQNILSVSHSQVTSSIHPLDKVWISPILTSCFFYLAEPPQFLVKLPPSTFVKQCESYRFECKTNNATSIKLCWYKNDQKLTVGDNYNIGFADSTAYLKLRTTSVEDNGVYTCEAYNDSGNASCSTVLTVQGQTLNRFIM